MKEIWKNIYGYDGLYQISNYGKVKSLKYGKEQILKPRKDKYGYLRVGLCKDGKVKNCQIHRLVGNAFIPNDDLSKTQINHIDEDKENNNVNNLEWCDCTYNINYGTRNEKVSKAKINGKTAKQVQQYSLDGNFIQSFQSTQEIQRELGFANCHICECCNGKRKTAYGFIWKYKNEEQS